MGREGRPRQRPRAHRPRVPRHAQRQPRLLVVDRLELFRGRADVEKVALTREQVDHYQPPPNPAKTTDSRYAKYAEEHGDESWEVDAIPPDELARIVRAAVEEYTDMDAYRAVIEREDEMRTRLERIR